MSCVVSIGDAYSHESPQAGTLLRLFELLHSVVVEPARVAEATYLKEHLPAAVDIDEFVVDAATQPPTLEKQAGEKNVLSPSHCLIVPPIDRTFFVPWLVLLASYPTARQPAIQQPALR